MRINRVRAAVFDGTDLLCLVLFSALFVCGAVTGAVSASSFSGTGLRLDPARALGFAEGGFFRAYISSAKYVIAVFLLAFCLPGVFLIPAVFAVRGFFLAYAVSVAARSVGGDYPAAVIVAYLPSALISVPCLYIAARRGFIAARFLTSAVSGARLRYPGPLSGDFVRTFGLVLIAMLLVSLFDCFCVPRLTALLFPALF